MKGKYITTQIRLACLASSRSKQLATQANKVANIAKASEVKTQLTVKHDKAA